MSPGADTRAEAALLAMQRNRDELLAAYGPATFVIVNAVRLVGAVCGGVASERKRAVRPAMV